jgi:hypothetical protein
MNLMDDPPVPDVNELFPLPEGYTPSEDVLRRAADLASRV